MYNASAPGQPTAATDKKMTFYLKCIIFISKEDLTMITAEMEVEPANGTTRT